MPKSSDSVGEYSDFLLLCVRYRSRGSSLQEFSHPPHCRKSDKALVNIKKRYLIAQTVLLSTYLIPILRKKLNIGNIRATPELASTLTMRDVTVVTRKNARNDSINAPVYEDILLDESSKQERPFGKNLG